MSEGQAAGGAWEGRASYVAAACCASAFYGFLGLFLIHDGLRRSGSFAEPVAAWSVAALPLGARLRSTTLAPGGGGSVAG